MVVVAGRVQMSLSLLRHWCICLMSVRSVCRKMAFWVEAFGGRYTTTRAPRRRGSKQKVFGSFGIAMRAGEVRAQRLCIELT